MPSSTVKTKMMIPHTLDKKDIINRFFDLEAQKLEIEKIRSQNEARELEVSVNSGRDATRIAEQDLDNYRFHMESEYRFKSEIASKLFRIIIVSLLVFTGMSVYLSTTNSQVFEKMIIYLHDIIKLVIGGVIGYLYKANRDDKLKSKE